MSLSQAAAAVRTALEDLQAQGVTALGVAVSGGGDSLALLHLGIPVARQLGLRLQAATVNHGLRPEAAAEAQMVAGFCARNDIPHQTLIWNRAQVPGNLQAGARAARYRLLAAWAQQQGLQRVLVAHNQEDLAETFLIRLGRAAGLDGLAAMSPEFQRHGVTFLRPLLDIPRADLRAHLRAAGIPWAEDPGNQDPHYARVRMRNLLQVLEGAGITPAAIAHSARALSDSRAWVERMLAELWDKHVRLHGGDLVVQGLPPDAEAARRLLVAALRVVGGGTWSPRYGALQDLMTRMQHQPRHTLAGCLIARRGDVWRISREYHAVASLRSGIDAWWDTRWRLTGPALSGVWVAALGQGIAQIPDWRDFTDLPRTSLMAGPAVWGPQGLIAAPLARSEADWQIHLRKGFGTLPFLH